MISGKIKQILELFYVERCNSASVYEDELSEFFLFLWIINMNLLSYYYIIFQICIRMLQHNINTEMPTISLILHDRNILFMYIPASKSTAKIISTRWNVGWYPSAHFFLRY